MTGAAEGELADSGRLAEDAGALRARMAEDGYLLMRGLLDPEVVGRVRQDILAVCARHGWTGPEPGTVDTAKNCAPGDPEYGRVYREVVSGQRFNELAHASALLSLTRTLVGDPRVIPRPAKRSHLMFPQRGEYGATPPHQDLPHEQGTDNAYTTWIPLGDCPRELGGLAVWPGSHRRGAVDHGFVPGVGGLGIPDRRIPDVQWHSCDYRMGDVLVFHCLTVHKALPNRTADRIRLSADFRYQSSADRFADHMLLPTGGALTWDEVYAGWSSDEYQYYWRDLGIVGEPYDYSHYERRDREVFDLARAGDQDAADFLWTISRRNPDPAVRQQAEDLIGELAVTRVGAR